ncbi:MAG: RluA family pseudouridine synthase [Deltaproteobacteria bacterium]|nr:RluA family pseudouridine synthase [Deltaproteobacteria bacterium]
MSNPLKIIIEEDAKAERLDAYLGKAAKRAKAKTPLARQTRSKFKSLIKNGDVLVNNKSVSPSYHVKDHDTIEINFPDEVQAELQAENIPLDILFEDNDVIVIMKQQGLSVHPGAGRPDGTLVNALLNHTKDLSDVGGPLRLGIVHRLDKDTSGVLVIAKNNQAHLKLAEQFKEHTTKRLYNALVWGGVSADEGKVELAIGRDSHDRKKISTNSRSKRTAVSNFKVLARYGVMTLVEVAPETGRTHQIRVHMASLKHPIVGDPLYCKRKFPDTMDMGLRSVLKKLNGQFLHARYLAFTHPTTNKVVEFSAPMPKEMEDIIEELERLS